MFPNLGFAGVWPMHGVGGLALLIPGLDTWQEPATRKAKRPS